MGHAKTPGTGNEMVRTANKKVRGREIEGVSVYMEDSKPPHFAKFSPSWLVVYPQDAPGFKIELIDRIREGVKKTDWKDLISYLGSTEKEFADILPTTISSMQKKRGV